MRYFKQHLPSEVLIDICISDEGYQEFAFYSDYKRIGKFLVKTIALPVFASILSKYVYEKSIVFTDKSASYMNITDYVDIHISEKSNEQITKETLKWVHTAISNAKRNFVGTYHKIKAKYLQLYLNEFVYKLNRRYFGERIFDRVVIASITANGH